MRLGEADRLWLTSATLAYGGLPDKAHHQEIIHHGNQPLRAKGVTRAASPFTIDSERLVRYMTPDEAQRGPTQAARDQKWAQRCADALLAVGVGWRNGQRLDVQTSSRSTRHARATPPQLEPRYANAR